MKFQDYKEAGKYENKGMAEILFKTGYRQKCKAPNKLGLFGFAESLGIKTPNYIGSADMVADKLIPELPENYCLKPINGAGARGVFLMKNGINLKDYVSYSKTEIEEKYLIGSKVYVGYSTKYYVEELLLTKDNDIPDDISFFMVGDTVGAILQAKRLGKGKGKVFYDSDWNEIGAFGEAREKPDYMLRRQLTATAKKIMKKLKLPCLRVDMYAIKGKGVFIGELVAVSGIPGNITTSFLEIKDGKILDKYLGYLLEEHNDIFSYTGIPG